ncbi:MAG TPA: hypothetical protein VF396_18955, partial [Bradyrhizobium sp.]
IDLDQENPQSNRMAADFMSRANSQWGLLHGETLTVSEHDEIPCRPGVFTPSACTLLGRSAISSMA